MSPIRSKLSRLLHDNGLSLVLISLFLLFLIGQAISGWHHYNDEQKEHGKPPVTFSSYLGTGAFGEAVFENWESEFLQMGLYVWLTAFLFQRGSAESKDPDSPDEKEEEIDWKRAPLPAKKGGFLLRLYNHSLSLSLFTLFAISFAGHAICGANAYNEEAAEHGQSALTTWQYLGSSQFWFESFQNWQSEFLAIFSIVVLSIWLREKDSPESKEVGAPHLQTGKA